MPIPTNSLPISKNIFSGVDGLGVLVIAPIQLLTAVVAIGHKLPVQGDVAPRADIKPGLTADVHKNPQLRHHPRRSIADIFQCFG